MIIPRAIAVRGIGYGAISVATRGLIVRITEHGSSGGIYYQNQKRKKIGRSNINKMLDKVEAECLAKLKGFAHSEVEEVKEIVAPFVVDGALDYESLQDDIDAIKQLMAEYQAFLLAQDEEIILILMLMG